MSPRSSSPVLMTRRPHAGRACQRRTLHTRLTPLASAIALVLVASSVSSPSAHAQARPFSSGWMAAKGAAHAQATATGKLPNGMLAGINSAARQQQESRQQLNRSVANLGSAAAAIAVQQATQAAARAAAQNDPSVPDGLAEGGLKIDGTRPLSEAWINAKAPVQTQADGRTNVAIEQTKDKAILNWETFNVGQNTTVDFKQQADWAVLNRVNDPQARPSQIQGQIKGDGTVMIANANGVVFSGTSQVNVRNLVAAAAKISDYQFTSDGLYGKSDVATFTHAGGRIEVHAGAQIATHEAGSVTRGGGYVLLLGSEVSNAGTITTRKGQAQLAAGDSFIIRKGMGTELNSFSTSRGNEVAPQFDANSTAGAVSNTGLILAREGDITLAGRDVRQNGVAVSTTTVNQRGTIHLLNSVADAEGMITLGSQAVTAVLIEDEGQTALDSQRNALVKESSEQNAARAQTKAGSFDNYSQLADRRDQSRIEIVSGGSVTFEGHSLTLATGGQIVADAKGRNVVAEAAALDVAGAVGVSVAMASNIIQINVQGNELRDSPMNRDSGRLANSNMWVDRRNLILVPAGTGGYDSDRYYTAGGLLEVGGFLGTQGHTIGEWAAQGGAITLGGKEVTAQLGSHLNLSGGTLDVQTGQVQQTWVRGSDGRLYDVNQAPSNIVFTGVYKGYEDTHERWGQTNYYYNPLIAPKTRLEHGYTVGRDAGTLNLNASTSILDGEIGASVFRGARQTRGRDVGVDGYQQIQTAMAQAATLIIGRPRTTYDSYTPEWLPVGSHVTISNAPAPEGLKGGTWLNAERLNGFGLGGLTVLSSSITIEDEVVLTPKGRFDFVAHQIDIYGGLIARSGSVSLRDSNHPLYQQGSPLSGTITLHEGGVIDTRGLWTNVQRDPAGGPGLGLIDGGDVFIRAGHIDIGGGARIDASSGGSLLWADKVSGGAGGDISIISTGFLGLGGELRSRGLTRGGALDLQAGGEIRIVDVSKFINNRISLDIGDEADRELRLDKDLVIEAGEALQFDYSWEIENKVLPGEVVDADIEWFNNDSSVLLTLTEAFSVPSGVVLADTAWNEYYEGDAIPAGTKLVYVGVAAGAELPAQLFPDGYSLGLEQFTRVAGQAAPHRVIFKAGQVVAEGTTFYTPVTLVNFAPELQSDFFGNGDLQQSSGFSSYTITGLKGIKVAEGVRIEAVAPVYGRASQAALKLDGGADPALAFIYELPPLYLEDPVRSTLTQRSGVNVSLRSGTYLGTPYDRDNPLVGGAGHVEIAKGASISVDPGSTIELLSSRNVIVNGALNARGGQIRVQLADGAKGSIVVGPDAVLNASAQAYQATDSAGRYYGVVDRGGAILIGGSAVFGGLFPHYASAEADITIAAGSVLDVSGSQVVLSSMAQTDFLRAGPHIAERTLIASDGGLITINTYSNTIGQPRIGGTMLGAAGGQGASGGRLELIYEAVLNHDPDINNPIMTGSRSLVLAQRLDAQGNLPMLRDVNGDLPTDGSDSRPRAALTVQQIEEGGFDMLKLYARSSVLFDGNIDLSLGRSLEVSAKQVAGRQIGNTARLNAPYVLFGGMTDLSGYRYPGAMEAGLSGGELVVNADLIDFRSATAAAFDTLEFKSRGDIRFLAAFMKAGESRQIVQSRISGRSGKSPNGAQPQTAVFDARQIYPTTNAQGVIEFIGDGSRVETRSPGGALPEVPHSVFGSLRVNASELVHRGVLRAPLGGIVLQGTSTATTPGAVHLLDGSIVSVSGKGLVTLYGGTVDGVRYTVDGLEPKLASIYTGLTGQGGASEADNGESQGIDIRASEIVADKGAHIDLSGGGQLLSAAFISGRGGSVDLLATPLINANPAYGYSSGDNQVFAIMPGLTSAQPANAYDTVWAGDVPQAGQQIEITAGVSGLPAGTYTLLPAYYALLPGGYRVEIGGQTHTVAKRATSIAAGVYHSTGVQSVANTGIRRVLPVNLTIISGETVRSFSQYNEQSYADFAVAQSALFGMPRPLLPGDGKFLTFKYDYGADSPKMKLEFDGSVDFSNEAGHFGGTLSILAGGGLWANGRNSGVNMVVTPDAVPETPEAGTLYVTQQILDSISAPNLYLGGRPFNRSDGNPLLNQETITFPYIDIGGGDTGITSGNLASLTLKSGVLLTGSHIVLSANGFGYFSDPGQAAINIEEGVTISTIGQGVRAPDSTLGYQYASKSPYGALVIVSNGWMDFAPPAQANQSTVTIAAGSKLYSNGSIAFMAGQGLDLEGEPNLGARYLSLALPAVNIGSQAALSAAKASGVLAPGIAFDQRFLDRLLKGDPQSGAPAVEILSLSASNSINFYGSTTIDTIDPVTGKSRLPEFVLNAPAFYGAGGATDEVVFRTDRLVWNGVSGDYPPAVIAQGAGTGSGKLRFEVGELVLGYPKMARTQEGETLHRLALGFSDFEINASRQVFSKNGGTLNVYHSGPNPQPFDPDDASKTFDPATYAGVGGQLRITTPLLTAGGGSQIHYRAGGAVNITAPQGPAMGRYADAAFGGRIYVYGGDITIDTAVAAPGGLVSFNADRELTLGQRSWIDVAGRTVSFFEYEVGTWGGEVRLESNHGNISQHLGGVIDLSATNEAAGRLYVTATGADAGRVLLGGSVRGQGGPGYAGGSMDLRAQQIGTGGLTADFAALNAYLNDGGFNEGLSLVVKQGDLTISDEIKARFVNLSLDGGSLTLNSRINASGAKPGAIRLAARDNLTIGLSAVLDVHGTELQVDTYGQVIEAKNRGFIDVGTRKGELVIAQNATFDLSSPDGVARGWLELSAPRLGGTAYESATGSHGPANARGNDIALTVGDTVDIRGAGSIAVNGTARYGNAPSDPDNNNSQVIDQAWLALIHQDNAAFIGNFYEGDVANGELTAAARNRMGGLLAYGRQLHLRPGVDIVSATDDGALRVKDNLQLAVYRYGPHANPAITASGEPLRLNLTAGGDLHINGSITDGFGTTPINYSTPWTVPVGGFRVDMGGTLTGGLSGPVSTFPGGPSVGGAYPFDVKLRAGASVRAGIPIPFEFWGNGSLVIPSWVDSKGGWVLTAQVQLAPTVGITASIFSTTANRRIELPDGDTGGFLLENGKRGYDRTYPVPNGTSFPAGTRFFPGAATWSMYSNFNGARFAAGSVISSTSEATIAGSMAVRGGPVYNAPIQVFTGTPFNLFSSAPSLAESVDVAIGTTLPEGMRLIGTVQSAGFGAYVINDNLLSVGMLSASIRLAAGADLASASTRTLKAASGLDGSGNLFLNDPRTHTTPPSCPWCPPEESILTSVIRTGTGNLDILAGGDYRQDSYFGVYTAGVSTGRRGEVWFPEYGGDLQLNVQGDLHGYNPGPSSWPRVQTDVDTWLKSGTVDGRRYWGVHFGSGGVSGFNGIGTLGGGNATLVIGGNAGNVNRPEYENDQTEYLIQTEALTFAVASTGQVTELTGTNQGKLRQTGGGDLSIRIGGDFNPGDYHVSKTSFIGHGASNSGIFVASRGDLLLESGTIGHLAALYGQGLNGDQRQPEVYRPQIASPVGGPVLVLGDSAAKIRTGGDLVLGGFGDYGDLAGGFLLHTENTAIDLFSLGGDVAPYATNETYTPKNNLTSDRVAMNWLLPSQVRVVANGGSIYNDANNNLRDHYSSGGGAIRGRLHFLPSKNGQVDFLARDSIYSSGRYLLVSSVDPVNIVSPFSKTGLGTNEYFFFTTLAAAMTRSELVPQDLTAELVTNLYAGSLAPTRFYAAEGDIINLQLGESIRGRIGNSSNQHFGSYIGQAKSTWIQAGRDIVRLGGFCGGTCYDNLETTRILNLNPYDVSRIAADRDIFFATVDIAGPGTLEITTGRNFYQGGKGEIHSVGPVISGDTRPGTDIAVQTGAGAALNTYYWDALRTLYLDPANRANPDYPLSGSDNQGKVVYTYEAELLEWLNDRFGFEGTMEQSIEYFAALAPEQQRVLLRKLYYTELRASGREYNDPKGSRFGSYLRGRQLIATLFPDVDAAGNQVDRSGAYTMFSQPKRNNQAITFLDRNGKMVYGGGALHTLSGGNIEFMVPGGKIVAGVGGVVPPSTAGLTTKGKGDIRLFSEGSLLLGLSRVMTTFGGDIFAWSEEGDINAGRGSKTTVVYTPPSRVYDQWGNVTLSPVVPSTGAGIATLNPIAEVAPGDIDLIAPLGTIDAGEAGIRVSGNVNIAALHVVNAANIQVQGDSAGIPVAAVVNTGALTSASAASASAATAAQDTVSRARNEARQNQPSIFSVQILGFGGQSVNAGGAASEVSAAAGAGGGSSRPVEYRADGPVRVVGLGPKPESAMKRLTPEEKSRMAL